MVSVLVDAMVLAPTWLLCARRAVLLTFGPEPESSIRPTDEWR
jgi:hypothetical protein